MFLRKAVDLSHRTTFCVMHEPVTSCIIFENKNEFLCEINGKCVTCMTQ